MQVAQSYVDYAIVHTIRTVVTRRVEPVARIYKQDIPISRQKVDYVYELPDMKEDEA